MRSEQEDADLLAKYLETKDPQLREQIVVRYVPLVHFVLGRLGFSQASTVDYEDVVSQANNILIIYRTCLRKAQTP